MFTRLFLLDPNNYKAQAQQLVNEKANQSAIVTYKSYQEVSGQLFPNNISIVANDNNKTTLIDITYRQIDLNVDVRFPFRIPDGYDEIIMN